MKTKLKIFSLILLLPFLFQSCKDDTGSGTPAASVSGTLNGANISVKAYEAGCYDQGNGFWVFVLNVITSSDDNIVVRAALPYGGETLVPYTFSANSSSDVVAYVPKGEFTYASNQFESSDPTPGTMALTMFSEADKVLSGKADCKVKRVADGKEATISLKWTNIPFSTELPPTPDRVLNCEVDGKAWKASNIQAIKSSLTNSIQIVGNKNDNTTIGLYMPDDVEPGTYDCSQFGDYKGQYNASPLNFMFSESGKITVTKHDNVAKVIEGTFSFEGDLDGSTVKVTKGEFTADY